VAIGHRPSHPDEVRGFRSKESGGSNDGFHLFLGSGGQCGRIGKRCEKPRHHHIYPLIGALRRKDGCRQELKGCLEVKSAEFSSSSGILSS
jgi:hypothetical protein